MSRVKRQRSIHGILFLRTARTAYLGCNLGAINILKTYHEHEHEQKQEKRKEQTRNNTPKRKTHSSSRSRRKKHRVGVNGRPSASMLRTTLHVRSGASIGSGVQYRQRTQKRANHRPAGLLKITKAYQATKVHSTLTWTVLELHAKSAAKLPSFKLKFLIPVIQIK